MHAKKKKDAASALETLREHSRKDESESSEAHEEQREVKRGDFDPIPARNNPADWTDPTKWPLSKPRKGS